MVEMQETAAILHNATPRSLVLFDEVGRGTSTFDGLSQAWSIIEYLHENQKLRPRTLFATHFHELVELEKYLSGVKNLNVAVREFNDRVIFIRKIVPGGCDRSFGIHVAMMAGIPPEVVSRAREVLRNLEANDLKPVNGVGGEGESRLQNESATSDGFEVEPTTLNRQEPSRHIAQLSFFDPVEHKLRDLLINVDPDQMTPVEALNLIATMKREIEPQK